MSLSKFTSKLIQCCMVGDITTIKSQLLSDQVLTDGNDKEKFYQFFEKTLHNAHKKSKGDWNLAMEPADWVKDKTAIAYDFYDSKSNSPLISVVIEEQSDKIWLEVLKG